MKQAKQKKLRSEDDQDPIDLSTLCSFAVEKCDVLDTLDSEKGYLEWESYSPEIAVSKYYESLEYIAQKTVDLKDELRQVPLFHLKAAIDFAVYAQYHLFRRDIDNATECLTESQDLIVKYMIDLVSKNSSGKKHLELSKAIAAYNHVFDWIHTVYGKLDDGYDHSKIEILYLDRAVKCLAKLRHDSPVPRDIAALKKKLEPRLYIDQKQNPEFIS